MLNWLIANFWTRTLLIIISLIFILGGVFNDGITRWLFALPFLWAFLNLLGYKKIWQFILGIIVIALISHFVLKTSFVYPLLSTKMTIIKPISINDGIYTPGKYRYSPQVAYQKDENKINQNSYESLAANRKFIDPGEVFLVTDVYDYGLEQYTIIFKNIKNKDEFYITLDNAVGTPKVQKSLNRDTGGQGLLCEKVEWVACEIGKADPMRKTLRMLSNLMRYPAFPLLLPNIIL